MNRNRIARLIASVVVFIILIVLSAFVVRPIYVSVTRIISEMELKCSAVFNEATGLRLSYKFLSPSIFSHMNMSGIEIFDAATGKRLVSIRSAVLSYDPERLNKETPLDALDVLTISGVVVEFDAVKDGAPLDKILSLLRSGGDGEKNSGGEDKPFLDGFRLPFDVVVKDVVFHYSDAENDALVKLKRLDLDSIDTSDGDIEFSASGVATVRSDYLKIGSERAVSAAAFSVSGNFIPALDGSSATVQLSNVGGADYSVSRLDSLVNYSGGKLQFRTMRTAFPFNMFAEFDVGEKRLHADMISENFDPFSLLIVRRKNDVMRKIAGSTISGNASADLNLGTMGVDYSADVSVNLSAGLLGERMKILCKASGNERKAHFRRLAVSNQTVSASYSGDFDILKIQPFGMLSLDYFFLENGSVIAADTVYLEPFENGVNCYVPQLAMNEKSITDINLSVIPGKSSVDFSGSLTDYSHSDYGVGKIDVDGSFIMGKGSYVQARAYLSDLFVDSVLDAASVFAPAAVSENLGALGKSLSPYVMSSEIFFSTDFDSFSYNVPYGFVANTEDDTQLLTFAFDGSDQNVQVSDLNLQYGSVSVQGGATASFEDGLENVLFDTDFSFNSMPYRFYGSVTPEWVSVSGDYGFDAMISLKDGLSGFFQFSSLPLSFGEYVFSLSTMSTFFYTQEDGLNMSVAKFEAEEMTGAISINPKISFSGELSKEDFVFNAFTYTDVNSELDMGGSLRWSFNESVFNNAVMELSGQSPLSTERISLFAEISNPAMRPFSVDSLLNDFYLSLQVSLDSFPASRFLKNQDVSNVINAELSATGTVADPFVMVDLSKVSLSFSGYPLDASGVLMLENGKLGVSDFNLSCAFFNLNDFNASFDMDEFSGKADAEASLSVAGMNVVTPLEFEFNSVMDEDDDSLFRLPEFFSVSVKSPGAVGNVFEKPMPFVLNVVHIPGQFDISTDNPKGFSASIGEDGFTARTGRNDTLMFNVDGVVDDGNMEIYIKDLSADLQKICSVVSIPEVSFPSGRLNGNVRIAGRTTDPEFSGFVDIDNLSVSIPMLSSHVVNAGNVQVSAGADGISLLQTLCSCGESNFYLSADVFFNRWAIDNVLLHLSSVGKKGVPLDLTLPFIHAKGEALADLDLSFSFPDTLALKGDVMVSNADLEIVTSELQNQLSLEGLLRLIPDGIKNIASRYSDNEQEPEEETDSSPINVMADLNFLVGNKVQILFNPLLRGLITPDTSLALYMDSASRDFALNGDVTLHGGEVMWLNRNFYMKEGRIVFNETQGTMDPRITILAETRETDDDGERITITLSAQNQLLSQLNPVFSSTPAKSETEIMTILGQVITADSEDIGSLMMAGGDYLMQATVIRKIENTLRELCNFDIFSVRTNVLQNTLKQGFAKSDSGGSDGLADESGGNQITFGNFFDNSTVYIGKYFGSAIYVDAMFHWVYDETKIDGSNSVNGLVFQPELGFEMASPFVNIRLGVSPDLNAVQQNLWVPSTSITLSWKHSF